MKDKSIQLRLTVDGEEVVIEYENADAAVDDTGIKMLFDDELVASCIIERGDKRLAGLPFMTWERFEQALEPYTSC